MFLTRLDIEHDQPTDTWPFTLPPVRQLATNGLIFERPVTFLVGENGSGKSTIIEAIAEVCKISVGGGKAGTKYASTGITTPLGEALTGDFTRQGRILVSGPRRKRKGFFLRAETLFNLARNIREVPHGFWDDDLERQSHGEGFFTVFESMFREPGLYLMDEPEAALSFLSCLRLVDLIHQLGETGAQIICATHSPILAATPGADIIQLDEDGFHREKWNDLAIVDHWRRFLTRPDAYLRHLTDDQQPIQ
ncbi:MAG: AAA family ATPase [Pseudonocardia sp.]|nr:AAA family ATPase [Pseudonocardia sp.]